MSAGMLSYAPAARSRGNLLRTDVKAKCVRRVLAGARLAISLTVNQRTKRLETPVPEKSPRKTVVLVSGGKHDG